MSEVDETVTTSPTIPENPDRVGLEAPAEQSEADVDEVSGDGHESGDTEELDEEDEDSE